MSQLVQSRNQSKHAAKCVLIDFLIDLIETLSSTH